MMGIEVYRQNRRWIKDKEMEGYIYQCSTKLEYPRVKQVVAVLADVNIVCCPLPKERVWLFKTEEEMNRFKQNWVTLDNAS